MKYYTVPIRPGVRLYVSVTIVPPDALATEISGFGTDVDLLQRRTCRAARGTTDETSRWSTPTYGRR